MGSATVDWRKEISETRAHKPAYSYEEHGMKKYLRPLIMVLGLLLIISGSTFAQDEDPVPVTATSDDLTKVNVLFVGAHPDDDSTATATLARYILDEGAKGAVITATRGEGGGNATGRQLGPSLGIVREAEERMALSYLGIDLVYYLNELDWAFTTSANATEQFWGYEEPLSNLVRLFRVLKPDVVITMNPSPSGHGQHQYIAKLATEAFFLAGDPDAFPEQLTDEFIDPWQPKKLYYALAYGAAGLAPSLQIPTNEFSPSQYMTYADLEAIALRFYRSQGFDAFYTVPPPARRLSPETFTLGASLLPIPEEETDLLAGITSGVAEAPARVELEVQPADYYVSQGADLAVEVVFRNYGDVDLSGLSLSLEAPAGWTVSEASTPVDVPTGETASASFTVSVPADADVSAAQTLIGRFDAVDGNGDARYASKRTLVQITPPVSMELQPIEAVRIYRDWARQNHVQHLVQLVPAEIAIGAGETGAIPVVLSNRSADDVEVTVAASLDNMDVTLDAGEQTVTVPAGETMTVDFMATVPADMAQTSFAVTASASYGDYNLADEGTLQIVPTLTVPAATATPTIDGDISEFADLPSYQVPFSNLWEGETNDAADLTGTFQVMYDDQFLYVAVDVVDDTVVSNIAPNDIKGHWRSDSVEITVDPQGAGVSEHTLTTFKTGIFPFDTEGNVEGERDADANQGLLSITAPDMQIASSHTDTGYILEVAIPWNAVPGEVSAGDDFGFNVLIYDCDKAEAAVGENCNEARTAWSAWGQIQGNPRLWGHATLGE
ncbi:MAG: PIG-L family deacetylase [Anaerolineae bacterium]|nr:PIG-L family deacetylase [Anaerolineae bacterium]